MKPMETPILKEKDPDIANLIRDEIARQSEGFEMIPSENHTSGAVLEALGSRLTDKYSEGYPGIRYYGGCDIVDKVENLARDRAKELFGATHANVQPHSGCPANIAVFFALLEPGDTIMGLKLFHGGHMTHGLKLNISGTYFNAVQYGCNEQGFVDLDEMRRLAQEHKPKLIVTGGSAYPQIYEWDKYKEIADEVGALLLADMSHVAGLVAGGAHPNPVGVADVVTTTTHKTLRGPRGAMILANGNPSTPLKKVEKIKENIPTLVDRAIIPGIQGGPHNHQTAAIAVALKEAMQPEFKLYAEQVVKNAKVLGNELAAKGYELVTGGTETHLILLNMGSKNLTGKKAEDVLGKAGITVNKNTIPHDPRKPFDPSGIRMGTPALTTRGMKEDDMKTVAWFIDRSLNAIDDEKALEIIHTEVKEMCKSFPLPS